MTEEAVASRNLRSSDPDLQQLVLRFASRRQEASIESYYDHAEIIPR